MKLLNELDETVDVVGKELHQMGREVLAQGKSLGALGPAGHAARLGGGAGAREAEDAATAGDDHPGGPGLGGGGEHADGAPVTVHPEQVRALGLGGGHHGTLA